MLNRKQYQTIFWILFAFSLVLFFAPIKVEQPTGFGLDKAVHFVLLATLTFAAFKSFSVGKFKIALLLIAYAIVVEYIQPYTGRDFDLYDALAGNLGTIFIAIIYRHE